MTARPWRSLDRRRLLEDIAKFAQMLAQGFANVIVPS